jgi:catalase
MADLSVEIVDAINTRDGRRPGFRAAHAKGICATGTFTATPAAAALTTASHMQGAPVPVTARSGAYSVSFERRTAHRQPLLTENSHR